LEAAMLPDIGLMIAAYIVTRMAELLLREPKIPGFVRLLAWATVIVTVACAIDILFQAHLARGVAGGTR
jgi:hypothetical protein